MSKILSERLNILAKQDYISLSKRKKLNKMEKERLERIKKYKLNNK